MAAFEPHVDLLRLLVGPQPTSPRAVRRLPASRFTSPAQFELERTRLFARTPTIVALSSDVKDAGACCVVDVAGVSTVVVRGNDGVVRGFRNACRHRGTELLDRAECDVGCGAARKAFTCRYHAWTYDLAGALKHVPHANAFGADDTRGRDLVAVHVAERSGFVFAALEPFDVDVCLDADLDTFGAADSVVYKRTTREVAANWKVLVDAFLDGYHIRVLHRDSVGRFFVDGLVAAEPVGPHIRALTARTPVLELSPSSLPQALAQRDLREIATPSYLVFPSTILIMHPDYTSVLDIVPLAADRSRFRHTMLVRDDVDDERRARYDKSFELIDNGVFELEDLAIVEAIQRGLATGANSDVLYGDLEHPSLWFHDTVDACIAR